MRPVLMATTQDFVCVFSPASQPITATGMRNFNGLQQEPELRTIDGL
jgi:hypothetical protein